MFGIVLLNSNGFVVNSIYATNCVLGGNLIFGIHLGVVDVDSSIPVHNFI